MDKRQADQYWKGTEVIRKCQTALPVFFNKELPYIFAAELPKVDKRVATVYGYVLVNSPTVLVPYYFANEGPQFQGGFEKINLLPFMTFFREIGFPYSFIDNKVATNIVIESGNLQGILKRHENELQGRGDIETALIKGAYGGLQVSLMRYLLELAIESGTVNTNEVLARLRKSGTPIEENEKITSSELDRLFNPNR